jgi:hypothetical protein
MQKGIVVILIIGLLAFFTSGCGSSSGNDASGSGSSYSVGVTASGLVGTGLTLQNNGEDDLPKDSDGTYTFAADYSDGAGYDVTVATRPSSPDQLCNVYEHSGRRRRRRKPLPDLQRRLQLTGRTVPQIQLFHAK